MLGLASIRRRVSVRTFGVFGFFISSIFFRYFGFDEDLSKSGAFAITLLGRFAIVFVSTLTCIILSSFTLPMTEYGTLNLSQIFFNIGSFCLSVITSILSCDSETINSVGDILDSLL